MENSSLTFDQPLPNDEQKGLRARGVLQESEVAVRVGDLLIAVDSLSGARRPISSQDIVVNEGRRQVLRG
jgi:hypothetical protein